MSTNEPAERPSLRERLRRRRQRSLRRRGLNNLRTALGEAGEQLTADWVLRDRDLEALRTSMLTDTAWAALMDQLRKTHGRAPLTVKVPTPRRGSVAVPAYPWPPVVVIVFWLALLAAFAELLIRAVDNDDYWLFIGVAALGTLTSAAFLAIALDKRVLRRRIVRRARPPGGEVQEGPPDQQPD